jgi:phosphopantothenoylcysteine decarboxylase/phosphopantothenate--cysteine ligase
LRLKSLKKEEFTTVEKTKHKMLSGKRIILGISGGIAAYKCVELVRQLKKNGAEVQVIMTADAASFVSKKSLSVVSGNPVLDTFWTEGEQWNNHVKLGLWADVLLVAPATANTIAKMALGLCDTLLLATYLSNRGATLICPAMDLDMWEHPAVQENIQTLLQRHTIIGPESGELASGLVGKGRMTEPEEIIETLNSFFNKGTSFKGQKILITAGPTLEKIDPVRYISNFSSGKMGYALAEEAAQNGAEVILISGPTQLTISHPAIQRIDVLSAEEMYQVVHQHWDQCTIGILAAAVADYAPGEIAPEKIKKSDGTMDIKLLKTKDILKSLGAIKRPNQQLIGFALETENEIPNAIQKRENKNCDFIVLNSTNIEGTTFGADNNKVFIINKEGLQAESEIASKKEIAKFILEKTILCS